MPNLQISYRLGKKGEVRRRVHRDFGGIHVVTSDVAIAADEESFRLAHPNVVLTGEARKQRSLKELLGAASPEELAELGVKVTKTQKAEKKDFPIDRGAGWFETSDGEKMRNKAEADDWQALLDEKAKKTDAAAE